MCKRFFEVDKRGVFYELSRFACGQAQCGGEVIYASSKSEAEDLYYRYKNGESSLKGALWLNDEDYHYRNIIHNKGVGFHEKEQLF